MKFKTGKCTNYSGCKLAYRGEKISAPSNSFRCPECGSPLEKNHLARHSTGFGWLATGVVLVLLATLGSVIYGFYYFSRQSTTEWQPTPVVAPTPEPTPTPAPTPVALPTPFPLPSPPPATIFTPTPTPTPTPRQLAFDLTEEEFARIKQEVIRRIDLMPELTAAQKHTLLEALQRARGMMLLHKVSFPTGQSQVSAADALAIRQALSRPEVAQAVQNPLLVFVILGYASQQGSAEVNLRLSRQRADLVANFLLSQAKIQNVIYPVPMGASTLFSKDNPTANQVTEIWLVVP